MTAPPPLRLQLLGGVRVEVGGRSVERKLGTRAIELLCYLAVYPRPHSREHLMAVLWPEKSPEKASANLRRALFLLRKGLGASADLALDVSDTHLGLRASVPSDLAEVEAAIDRWVRSQKEPPANPDAMAVLEATLGDYRGDLLADQIFDWTHLEREHLRRRLLDAGRGLVACLVREGAAPERILAACDRILAIDPHEETVCTAAIQCRGELGDRAGAAALYQMCRAALRRDLGVSPSQEMEQAYRTALTASPAHRPPQNPEPWTGSLEETPALSAGPLASAGPPASAEVAAVEAAAANEPAPGGEGSATSGHSWALDRGGGALRPIMAWSGALAVLAGAILTVLLLNRHGADRARLTAAELVNEHRVASYMEDLPVTTSEPAVVDRWFASRVHYPVRSSNGGDGFTLYGGGVCDLAGEIAATAVYRSADDRRVTLFSFPEGDLPLPSAPPIGDHALRGLQQDRYSIVYFAQGGLVRALVSEMPVGQLVPVAEAMAGDLGIGQDTR